MSPEPMPDWERRFRAPTVGFPAWSRHASNRMAFASTEGGSWQLFAWDPARGIRRRATDEPVGVDDGYPTADGEGVLWFRDETGDESGQWMVAPFDGGEPRPFLPGIPHGWQAGLALGLSTVAAAVNDRDGYRIHVSEGGGPARSIHEGTEWFRIGGSENGGFVLGGLSADEMLLCLEHSGRGDLLHPALRVVEPRTGEVIGEQWDGEGLGLRAAAWSPVLGDERLAIGHEREGEDRPAVWNLVTGERRDISLDLDGMVDVRDWWPDGSALLLANTHEGRDRLYRLDLASEGLSPISHPPGSISGARVRPDGAVWLRISDGATEPRVIAEDGREVIGGERAPAGQPYRSWSFSNPHGQRVHGFVVVPPGGGPHPVVMEVHGGPTSLYSDAWSPYMQALVDAGFAVGMVNYRGSTGYGSEWRNAIIGNVGFPETEDVVAGLDDLIGHGIADPSRAVIGGWSWGGYITLLALGTHPERWAAGVAGIPVGDYEASYDDSSPELQAYDRALLGGSVHEVPDLVRERSPITYVDRVRAPVLILAGENDSRCPIRQVMNYVEALRDRDGDLELYLFGTGHGSYVVDEEVRQMRAVLDFLERRVSRS